MLLEEKIDPDCNGLWIRNRWKFHAGSKGEAETPSRSSVLYPEDIVLQGRHKGRLERP